MNLLLTLQGAAGPRHVEVTLPDGATAADLAERLAPGCGLAADAGPLTLKFLPVSGGIVQGWCALAPEADLRTAGLRRGDHVELLDASAHSSGADVAAVVVAVDGPDAGAVFPLRAGANLVGRDDAAAVRLTDPLVALRHVAIHVGTAVEVVDLGSTGGVVVGGTPATRAPFRPGETLAIGATALRLGDDVVSAGAEADPDQDVVTASPRVLPPLPDAPVELPQPPAEPEPRRMPRAALLAPALMGLAMYAVTGRALSLVFVVMSPLMMVGGVLDARWERRRRLAALCATFDAEADEAERRLVAREPDERAALEARYPTTVAAGRGLEQRDPMLWSRRPEHTEFLTVRLGTGSVAATAPPEALHGSEGVASARERHAALTARFSTLSDAPIVASLGECGSLGIGGAEADSVARALLLQLAATHSPLDCALVVAGADPGAWQWAQWLPHTAAARTLLGRPAVATGRAVAGLVDALEDLVATRAGTDIAHAAPSARDGEHRHDAGEPGRASVVVMVDDHAPERPRLLRLAERGPDVGVHVLWSARTCARVPGACRTVVDTDRPGGPVVGHALRGGPRTALRLEHLSEREASRLARRLAPMRDAAHVTEASTALGPQVPLVSLHGAEVLDPAVHAARWRSGRMGASRGSLRALVGHASDGPMYIDLAREGPHALVGGTTGAGKSELLQAWILGMACAHGPESLSLLLVDYKGGAAFADCVRLPHAVGLVTDLDPRLATRVLTSLRAELRHRERQLAAAGAKDLDSLLESGAPAPPRLVIVIDEFATLVAEVPAFVDGVIDIAQRGRSLGLHLIMATQRPAGVIRDNLRANTNLRIALRMADEADSRDVLGDPGAAQLDPAVPGRALARTGPGRIRRFQSAFGGARSGAPGAHHVQIEVSDVDPAGWRRWPTPVDLRPPDSLGTDAERVVDALRSAHEIAGGAPVHRPWLDELPAAIPLEELPQRSGALVVGRVDDPARQRQDPLVVDLEADGGVLIVAGPGAGASAALRSFAAAAALAAQETPIHVYGIDAGGGGLAPLTPLPHVGDVVEVGDAERIRRLLGTLARTVRERRATGWDRSRGGQPRVLLLVDGAADLQAECLHVPGREQVWEDLRAVVGEGAAVGVHVALAAGRSGALHTSLRALMTRQLVLRTSDESEYALAGLRSARVPADAPPGRGFDAQSGLELQIAVPGGSPRLDAQAQALGAIAAASRAEPPARVPRMPLQVEAGQMPAHVGGLPVLGIEEQSLAPMGVALDRPFVIAGPAGSGRTAALAWLGTALRAQDHDAAIVHLSMRRSSLSTLPAWSDSLSGPDAGQRLLSGWGEALAQVAEDAGRVTVMVEHLADLGPSTSEQVLVHALRQAIRLGHVVVAEADTQSWLGPLAGDIKAARRGIVLSAEPADVQVLLGVRGPRASSAQRPPGRAVAVEPGRVSVVQIPWLPGAFSTDR
ncbi:FtsK/SpoIIIE domain-containing protein [Demequina capsici]|uniref:FtsK/SpoIIIE domain-containing protein n=1 Tax=Demequina capsici TaxID=3075620 RepID=A0AA96FA18_9MICO|nr:FtsK/SpoIIIE domain-containing protein [Demequina sp. PMTSA13]WNM26946.1 FtsK/SpoIIIE domain-containing protein [Demequina sp. PMTSA13]